MDSAAKKALVTVGPWALVAAGVGLLLYLFRKEIPKIPEAAGEGLGGLFGGLVRGATQSVGSALGFTPNETPIMGAGSLPIVGEISKSASITSPANNGTAARGVFGNSYVVTGVINWPGEQAVLVSFEAKEYPRALFDNGVSRKTTSLKLVPGRNLVRVEMPISVSVLLGVDVVLTLSVDGDQYASSSFYLK